MDDPFLKLDNELNAEEKKVELEEQKEMQKTFREVFSNYDGKKVLNVILNDLLFFQPCKTERDVALRNYATFLLEERMGFKDTISIVENLLKSEFE